MTILQTMERICTLFFLNICMMKGLKASFRSGNVKQQDKNEILMKIKFLVISWSFLIASTL